MSTRPSISIAMRFAEETGLYSTFTPSFLAMYLMKSMSYPTNFLVFGSTEPNGGRESFTPATSTPFFFISASVSPASAAPHRAPIIASARTNRPIFLAIISPPSDGGSGNRPRGRDTAAPFLPYRPNQGKNSPPPAVLRGIRGRAPRPRGGGGRTAEATVFVKGSPGRGPDGQGGSVLGRMDVKGKSRGVKSLCDRPTGVPASATAP